MTSEAPRFVPLPQQVNNTKRNLFFARWHHMTITWFVLIIGRPRLPGDTIGRASRVASQSRATRPHYRRMAESRSSFPRRPFYRPRITTPSRRFPPPWTVEEYWVISYIVRDANNFAVAYVYFENEPGRRAAANLMSKDEARKVANGMAKLPKLLRRPQPRV